jgi:hypothetical protein
MYVDCAHKMDSESMSTAVPESNNLRVENINLRVSRNQKALIDRAAEVQGRSRSDFMLRNRSFSTSATSTWTMRHSSALRKCWMRRRKTIPG